MRVARGKRSREWIYSICNQPLEQVEHNPYLRVLLNHDMKWTPHITKVAKRANGILGSLRRNL